MAFGVLVVWWLVVVVVCVVLVCLVLVVCCVGITPLWCGVLVDVYVGVNVCVFLRGCCLMWFGGVGVLVVC